MKTIAVASAKGGTGKTTLTSALAMRAADDFQAVGMLDLNHDQASLSQWNATRGELLNPKLIPLPDNLTKDVRKLASELNWLFIDTPPVEMDLIEASVMLSDAVIVPVRCGFFDVMAVDVVAEMARERRKPFAFVLNAVDHRFKTILKQTLLALSDIGPVFKTQISCRQAYVQALVGGKTGPQIAADLKGEIDGVWREVQELVESGKCKQ